MKIKLDKALLWLLPYLYLVSIAYYWGFWGTFDVDAFNYYPVSDLVKGVTGPISTTFIVVAVVAPIVALGKLFGEKIGDFLSRHKKWAVGIVVLLAIAIGLKMFFSNSVPSSTSETADPFQVLRLILTGIGTGIAIAVNDSLPERSATANAVRYAAILFVCLMPFQANVDGRMHAWRIAQSNEYEYVIADSLAVPERAIYKYLGKAGEYYILLSSDNAKRIIVPTSKLNPLVIERFSFRDADSQTRLARYKKQLVLVSPPRAVQPK